MTIQITSEPQASPDDIAAVIDALNSYNVAVTGDNSYSPLSIFLRDENAAIVGGLIGDIWGGWLHIRGLWIAASLRNEGYGTQLLQAAEDEARMKGCRGVHLESFDFQAPHFYERFGYTIFAEIPDYPAGHTNYFLRKLL